MSLHHITRTAKEVMDTVKRQFGDEAGVQIANEDIVRWINSGQLEIASKHRCLKAVSRTNIVKNQEQYDLTGLRILQIESVHFNGARLTPMNFADAEQFILEHRSDEMEKGDPHLWYTWGQMLYVWPQPREDAEEALTVYYTRLPTDITSSTDKLSIPDRYYEPLLSYVMAKAYQLDEEFEVSNLERAAFESQMDERSEEEYQAANITYPLITIVD